MAVSCARAYAVLAEESHAMSTALTVIEKGTNARTKAHPYNLEALVGCRIRQYRNQNGPQYDQFVGLPSMAPGTSFPTCSWSARVRERTKTPGTGGVGYSCSCPAVCVIHMRPEQRQVS